MPIVEIDSLGHFWKNYCGLRERVVEPPFEPGIINPRLMRLRPACGVVVPRFLKHLLLTSGTRRQLDSLAGGGTMPVINGKVIRRFVVPMLKVNEQERIVESLDILERSIDSFRHDRKKLAVQKHGLMHDLLTGRVRVRVAESAAA